MLAARAAAGDAQQSVTAGRVVVTVTTLDGTVHLPGVRIELRGSTDATVLAGTSSDDSGIVTFPDVPPGRYVVRATREGFLPADSAVFGVRANEVAQVLVDIQLTFVMPPVDVRSSMPSPTNSVQPVSMSDMATSLTGNASAYANG